MVSRAIANGWPLVPPSGAPPQGGGVPANALLLNGQPVLLNGQYITYAKAA